MTDAQAPNSLYQMIQNATFPTAADKQAALEMAVLMTPQPAVPAVSATTTALIDLLRQRDAAGLKKYGTTLDRTDLSLADWLQHMTEELLDGAGYALAALRTLNEQGAMVPGSAEAHRVVIAFYPDDRFYQEADRAWWRNDGCRLVRAEAPAGMPYSIDEDPAGIRARVADAITGALMTGAQGTNVPPEDHWLAPFWQMARAEAKKTERPKEDDAPIDADDNAYYIEHCADKLKRLGYPITGSVLKTIAGEHRRLAAMEHRPNDIDSIALDAARRCTPEGEPQRRARMQCAIGEAIKATQAGEPRMLGRMVEGDFSTSRVTFEMSGDFELRAGMYRIQRIRNPDGKILPDPPRSAPSTQNRN